MALAPAGGPPVAPMGFAPAPRREPVYPDVSAFTGGRPDPVPAPGTATPPPLTRRSPAAPPAPPAPRPAQRGSAGPRTGPEFAGPRTGPESARPETGNAGHGRPSSVRRAPARPDDRRSGPGRSGPPTGPTPQRRPGAPSGSSGPTPAVGGRLAVAAVAVGALATAGQSLGDLAFTDSADTADLAAGSLALASHSAAPAASASGASTQAGDDAATSGVMAVPAGTATGDDAQSSSLSKAKKRTDDAKAAAEAAKAPKFIKPAQGRFTSGFGSRWGSEHKGVDIAGPIGTPIVSVADGVVTAAGPASGFGQWVKVRLADGSETVYGHVNKFFVSEGDKVKAGQEIAEIGNRGQSTGPHLHFEVHTPGGKKINPLPWLAEHGISLGAQQD